MKELTVVVPPACCSPGAPPLQQEAARSLASRFKALADPSRVAIVNRLAGADDVCVCDFIGTLGLSQPTVSHHLRVLREAGLVEVARKRGTWVHYRLVPDAVAELALALGRAGVNIEDMSLFPAADRRTGAISLWIAGLDEARQAADVVAGLGHEVAPIPEAD